MENAVKAIMIAAGVIITLVVVSFGFMILKQGKLFVNESSNKLSDMSAEMLESEYTQYDGVLSNGSVVSNVVKDKKDEIKVVVKTKKNTSGEIYNSETTAAELAEMYKAGDNDYINPKGKFMGAVTRDANGAVISITFTQE